ncbi:conserved hypothetical protein [Aspergillus udagawae]|nr:conserved hypothetical protein [Aspergillus udagawae]
MATVFIGAAGEMCRVAVERFATVSDAPIVLADINVTALESLAAKLPAGRASIKKLDLFDKSSLNETIRGAALVVLGAGPYMRTSEPVLKACLAAKVPYLDFDDDVQSTLAALDLQEQSMPEFHATLGVVETTYAPMLGEEGETLLHETAHPEPVTLPRIFPTAKRIRCAGALGPAPFNGIARGLGQADPSTDGLGTMFREMTAAFRGGDITVKELFQLVGQVSHSLSPWRYALYGMIKTIWTGECTTGEVLSFLVNSARGKRVENKGSLLVRAVGLRNGHPATITKRTAKSGEHTFLSKTMGTVTGTATAAFMLLALEDGLSRSGVYCPEDWAEPKRFYHALERLGSPKDELVITL